MQKVVRDSPRQRALRCRPTLHHRAARHPPTIPIAVRILVRVKRHPGRVRARELYTVDVAHDVKFLHCLHAKSLHTFLHVEVLTPTLPRQGHAADLLVTIQLYSLVGEHLQGALHGNVWGLIAVLHVGGRLLGSCVRQEQGPQSAWKKDRVRVDLHNPVVLRKPSLRQDDVPSVHERARVQPRSPRSCPVVYSRDLGGNDRTARAVAKLSASTVAAEDLEALASEDAGLPLHLRLDEAWLVARCPHHAEAKQRSNHHCGLARPGAIAPALLPVEHCLHFLSA
mmetsp:Transcript_56609/g.131976  ORF Transcript_56609/g.131976 Transcript_56609/m.131976 type:complete len:282 (+) Transcript_56609:194-1039(+)